MNKIIKIILVVIGTFLGIILLDTVQALVFNNTVIIGRETNCMRKEGIFVDTYHCVDGRNITRLKKTNICYTEDVCGDYLEELEDRLQIIEEGDVSMSLKANTLTSSGATFVLKNNSDLEYVYGPDYTIEKRDGEDWKELNTVSGEPLTWNTIAYILNPEEEIEINIDWSLAYGELGVGEYRLVKRTFENIDRPIDESKILYIYTEFSIN